MAKKITVKKHQVFMRGKQNGKEIIFRCDHCEYYSDRSCNNESIINLAKKGEYNLKMKGDVAEVNPEDCSDFYYPK